ncbi:MAG: methyltransferase domain-containing protein [Clostridia bacterium]|nr:methyltransferase domain-containing protein [Clostridia bacterium]
MKNSIVRSGFQLNEGEQIDDLQCAGLKILQKKGTFRYGTDAVLLANFAADHIKKSVRLISRLRGGRGGELKILDAGTGTGIVPILMYGKLNVPEEFAPGRASYTAVEIQPEMCSLAARSLELNGIGEHIKIVNADICESGLDAGTYDIVTINPPYVREGSGIVSETTGIAAARHEISRTQEEMLAAAASLLRTDGMLFMINRPDRLTDAMTVLRASGAEPAELTMVHAFSDRPPVMFLLSARKGGGKGLRVTAPRILE